MDDELEFLKAKRLAWEMRLAFQQRERQRLAAEVEAQEELLRQAAEELDRAKAAVCEQIRVLGIKPN